jgi:CheY-like chemotaxis protein
MMERPDERGDDESLPSQRGEVRGVQATGSRPQPEFSRLTHILVVDDDPAMRTMIADYLADQNMRVSVAADSREMQRVLAAEGIDLVVLDLKLGNEDGLAIVRALRAQSNLPIIVLTGHRREAVDRVVGLELGADDYLTKPFSPRELLARIHAVLRRAPSARQAHTVPLCRLGTQPADPASRLSLGRERAPDQGGVRPSHGLPGITAARAHPGTSARGQPGP